MFVKPMIESDIIKIKKLQPEGWPNIVEAFKYYYKASFCYPIKAIIEGEIVGIGTVIS